MVISIYNSASLIWAKYILVLLVVFIVFVCFYRPHTMLLKIYSWLCIQGLLLAVFRGPFRIWGTDPGSSLAIQASCPMCYISPLCIDNLKETTDLQFSKVFYSYKYHECYFKNLFKFLMGLGYFLRTFEWFQYNQRFIGFQRSWGCKDASLNYIQISVLSKSEFLYWKSWENIFWCDIWDFLLPILRRRCHIVSASPDSFLFPYSSTLGKIKSCGSADIPHIFSIKKSLLKNVFGWRTEAHVECKNVYRWGALGSFITFMIYGLSPTKFL